MLNNTIGGYTATAINPAMPTITLDSITASLFLFICFYFAGTLP